MSSDTSNLPILYSFRRCPYAMRARMVIAYAGQPVELREILLKDKPQTMLDISPKATVPVLVESKQQVVDESIDIMFWALSKNDPSSWYFGLESEMQQSIKQLIQVNDQDFKPNLDQYKYAARFPENTEASYRDRAIPYLNQLEKLLINNSYLFSNQETLADIAIFPFIRQFAFVNKAWFDQSEYVLLRKWLNLWLGSSVFSQAMTKYPQWQNGDEITIYPSAQN
jgi:glutathione S-transferase